MKTIILTLISLIILISCSESTDPNYDSDFATIDSLDVKSGIGLANEWKFTKSKISSHVTPIELIVEFPDGRKVKKPLPSNEMYVAIAPYIENTHDCSTHYPSSCDGELKLQTFAVTVKDSLGNIIYGGNQTTMKNGFFELWLPRNLNITLQIAYNSLYGDEIIGTFDKNKTCITTVKLK
ncbi:MAG: CueP family metal-binding protein [Ignavibacteriae bacterium]|nr:CueP family metal-binding protein [Ignavibacteriota bacterium]